MPETPQAIRGLAETMVAKFTPPSFVPGCEVKSIADVNEYTTDNGWIEAVVGGDNQQRVRYYGTPQGVGLGDFVDVEYFPAYKLYRVFGSTLGGTAVVGGVRVNKVWDSDFANVALEAGTVNLTVQGTRTLTIPTDLIHAGGPDTKLSFTDDDVEIFAGNLSMLKLTETVQDLITLGPGSGDVDIDFNGDMFLLGSTGSLAVGPAFIAPTQLVHLRKDTNAEVSFKVENLTDGTAARAGIRLAGAGGKETLFGQAPNAFTAIAGWNDAFSIDVNATTPGGMILSAAHASGSINMYVAGRTSAQLRMKITAAGFVGIGTITPSTRLDIDAGAMEFAEMTAPAAGAANTARLFARDDGGGDTELCARFNSGLIQVIAPLEFGEISRLENTTATALTVSTPAHYLFFDTNGVSNGATPDHTNDHITVNKTGTYLITCSITALSVAAGTAIKVEFTILKNNGATQVGALHADRNLAGGGGDVGSISLSGLAVLTSGDTIELWLENETNSNDLIIEDAILSIMMIGVNA